MISVASSSKALADPGLNLNYAMVVHGEQEFVLKRPIHPGDRLSGAPRIASIDAKGRNEFLVYEASIHTEDGTEVAIARSTVVSRGTAEGA